MDISLYFHVPFCLKKCPYCHFCSFTPKDYHVQSFMEALFLELKQKEKLLKNRSVVSIYFGGGTPTFLSENNLKLILNWISSSLDISSSCEITIETNPGISKEKILHLKEIGFNRVSVGVESFNDKELKILGRTHTKKDIFTTLDHLHKHFDNISIDLLYDIPHQTKASFAKTLQEVQSFFINHISLYNLTFEPKTPYFRDKEKLLLFVPNNTLSLEMLNLAILKLKEMGFKRYEISAFAKEGKISHHNTGYWIGREFLGFGPSAFSYLNQTRFQNSANFQNYIQSLNNGKSPICFEEKLDYPDNIHELLAINLRMLKGIDIKQKKWNLPKNTLQILSQLEKENFLTTKNGHIQLTKKGLLFYDEVAEIII